MLGVGRPNIKRELLRQVEAHGVLGVLHEGVDWLERRDVMGGDDCMAQLNSANYSMALSAVMALNLRRNTCIIAIELL